MKKRLISLVVTTAMLASLVPVSFAEKDTVNEAGFEEQPFESVQITDGELFERVTESEDAPTDATNDESIGVAEEFTDDTEIIADDEVDAPEISKDIELFSDGDFQLMATGTYYSEYGIYFDASSGTITDADDNISGTLNIPETIDGKTVLQIGWQAFRDCKSLVSVNIPKTVTSIGSSAFRDCINLSNITLNYNNTREFTCAIGSYAFSGCTNLTGLAIPNSVTTLGSCIIAKTAIESITIPKSVKSADRGVLADCPSLTTVILEDGITAVPYGLCDCSSYNNSYIENVTIPDSVTEIGSYAFDNCDALKAINIPKGVKTIGWAAFRDCDNLTNIVMNYNNTREFECAINGEAFSGCTNLTELIIPSSVTKLGSAIIAKTAIESITIPKSVKSADRGVLANCPSLTTVILEDGITAVPYGLCDCSSYNNSYIENVTIPDSVTEIGSYAFNNCDAITEVNIPKNVKKIGYEAYENCSSLSKVTFNYNDEEGFSCEIGTEAFADCPNIKELSLPEKITSLGYQFIRGTAISSITVPSTVTSASSAFDGAIWLDDVYFADGITKIPNEICANYNNNSYIQRVEIPMSVTEVGYEAFENCKRLTSLTLPEGVTKIGYEAFNNCPALTVYCLESMPAITDIIDNNVNFSLTKNIASYDNFVFANTHYITDYSDVSSAGMVNLEVKYDFKEDVRDRIKNTSVIIRLPDEVEIINSTVKVNGITSTDFTNSDNLLTIPVTEMEGTIALCVEPTEQTRILSYAVMQYRLDNNWSYVKDVIGVINQNIPLLTIKADDVTASDKITVSGIAIPEKKVDFYLGRDKLGTTTALISGKYQTELTLPSVEDYKTYTIEAVSTDNSYAEITAETKVMYQEDAPELLSFDMYYNGVKYDLFAARDIKPTITFASNIPFAFKVKFNNADKLDSVYIVSNRNNSIKKMKAEYDSANGMYVASGYFDDSNHSYVPGVISVEYLQKSEPYLFSDTIDFTSAKYVNTLPEAWEDNKITLYNDDNEPEAVIQLLSVDEDSLKGVIKFVNTIRGDLDFNIFSEKIPEYIHKQNASEYGYNRVIDDAGEELYVKVAEQLDSKIQSQVLDFAQGKVSEFLVENKAYGADMTLESLNSISSVLGDVQKVVTFNNNRVDINNAKQEVMNSSRSPEEKQAAMKNLELAQQSNNANLAIMMLSTALAASGVGLPAACGLILTGLSYQNTAYIESALGDWSGLASRQSTGTNLTFRWKIDPSGYVYEAVTTNRLEGVTATAYWKEDESSKSEMWNAEEWQQANPLTTDINGLYSWDVPEGLWQVKYEKDGYETQTSDWLPVPPPQTDVNIGLVSKATPKVEVATLNSNSLTVTFDKYMKPETVNNVTIGSHTYTIDYNKNETAPDGTIYAKTYTFKLNEPVSDGERVAVSIKDAESYADVKMAAYSETLSISNETPTLSYLVEIDNVLEDKDNKKISADYTNLTEKIQAFDAICAVYNDNGELVGIKTIPIVALDGNSKENKVFAFDKSWASYKLFAWDSIGSMKAIAESI